MPRPVDNSVRGEGVADVPQIDGARDESTAAWFAFRDQWTAMLNGYFRRLPCTRAQRDELVMDVLVDAFAAAHEGSRGTTARETIWLLARQASAQFQRLVRHEVQLEEADSLPADEVCAAAVAERERLWKWLEPLLEMPPRRASSCDRAATLRHEFGHAHQSTSYEPTAIDFEGRCTKAGGLSLPAPAPPVEELTSVVMESWCNA